MFALFLDFNKLKMKAFYKSQGRLFKFRGWSRLALGRPFHSLFDFQALRGWKDWVKSANWRDELPHWVASVQVKSSILARAFDSKILESDSKKKESTAIRARQRKKTTSKMRERTTWRRMDKGLSSAYKSPNVSNRYSSYATSDAGSTSSHHRNVLLWIKMT